MGGATLFAIIFRFIDVATCVESQLLVFPILQIWESVQVSSLLHSNSSLMRSRAQPLHTSEWGEAFPVQLPEAHPRNPREVLHDCSGGRGSQEDEESCSRTSHHNQVEARLSQRHWEDSHWHHRLLEGQRRKGHVLWRGQKGLHISVVNYSISVYLSASKWYIYIYFLSFTVHIQCHSKASARTISRWAWEFDDSWRFSNFHEGTHLVPPLYTWKLLC